MIENLKNLNDRDEKLSKFTEEDIEQMYLRVFNSKDGELVLHNLANRCFVYEPAESEYDEGMRGAWLSIQSRLRGAVAPERKGE